MQASVLSASDRPWSQDQVGRGIMFAAGLMAPFGLFNTFTIGDSPVSLMWIVGLLFAWAQIPRLRAFPIPYAVLFCILAVKALWGGSSAVALKFFVGLLFLLSLSELKYQGGISFLKGLAFLLPVQLLFAAYQWLVLLLLGGVEGTGATLPIELWNSKGWHVVLPDDSGIPRAPSFMFEPAYFAMILNIILAGELLYRREGVRRLLLLQIFAGLILANSRVGLFAAMLIIGSSSLVKHQKLMTLRLLAICAAIGPLLPLPFISEQLLNFADYRDVIDISVFSRYISFAAFTHEDVTSMLFGVLDYKATFVSNPIFSSLSNFLEDQGSDMDPKSFLASNLFYFGVIGSAVFYGGQIYVCRSSAVSLAMLASVNIIFFNVYPYSWPIYWLFISLILVTYRTNFNVSQVGRPRKAFLPYVPR